jgi:hypothetical protein
MQGVASAAKRQGQQPRSIKGQREAESVEAKKGKESKGPVWRFDMDMRAPLGNAVAPANATSTWRDGPLSVTCPFANDQRHGVSPLLRRHTRALMLFPHA